MRRFPFHLALCLFAASAFVVGPTGSAASGEEWDESRRPQVVSYYVRALDSIVTNEAYSNADKDREINIGLDLINRCQAYRAFLVSYFPQDAQKGQWEVDFTRLTKHRGAFLDAIFSLKIVPKERGAEFLKVTNDAVILIYKKIETWHSESQGTGDTADTAERDLNRLDYDCNNLVGEMQNMEKPQ